MTNTSFGPKDLSYSFFFKVGFLTNTISKFLHPKTKLAVVLSTFTFLSTSLPSNAETNPNELVSSIQVSRQLLPKPPLLPTALPSPGTSQNLTSNVTSRVANIPNLLSQPSLVEDLLKQKNNSANDLMSIKTQLGYSGSSHLLSQEQGSTSVIAQTTSNPPANVFKPTVESVQTDFSYQYDNYGLTIYSIEPSIKFAIDPNNKITLKSGFISLQGQAAPRTQDVTIIPVRLGWEGQVNQFALKAGATLYSYDRLPSAVGFDANVNFPVLPNLFIGASIERTPMKYAPSTLENPGVTTFTSYGPNLYWQIDRDTSLFGFYSFLNPNDGNRGQISYTKLKRQLGQFSIAANLVTTSWDKGSFVYFAPPDYLIYNGEIGWQGDLTDFLNFRVQFNLGEQRLQGAYSNAYYYEAQFTAKLGKNLDAFLNYSYGKLGIVPYYAQLLAGSDTVYGRSLIVGQFRYTF